MTSCKTPTCIIIMGMPRGGTSATAGVIHHLGVNIGPFTNQIKLDPNPKGYFENDLLVNHHARYTGHNTIGHWDNLKESYDNLDADWLMLYRQQIGHLELVSELNDPPLWGFKDLRVYSFCQEFLDRCRSEIKVVHVVRNKAAVKRSMAKYPEADILDIDKVYSDWDRLRWRALESRFFGLFPRHTFNYESLVKQPNIEVGRIADFIGVNVTQEAVDLIDPNLNRNG